MFVLSSVLQVNVAVYSYREAERIVSYLVSRFSLLKVLVLFTHLSLCS